MPTGIDFCGLHLWPSVVATEGCRHERLTESQQGALILEYMYLQDAGATPLPLVLGQKHPGDGWRGRSSPTVDEFSDLVRSGRTQGIGVPLRENDVVIDIEGRARDALSMVLKAAERADAMPLLERAVRGLTEETPTGGLHIPLWLLDGSPSRKQVLARRPKADGKTEVLVEALGFGQQVVVAPSGGMTHPTGRPYRRLCGDPSTIATVTSSELEQLLELFRHLDEMPVPQASAVTTVRRPETPIERDFNDRKPWKEILEPHCWRFCRKKNLRSGTPVDYWTRPGKSGGTSASTCGRTLCVFSTEAGLPAFELPAVAGGRGTGGLSKFEVFTFLNHDGDRGAALNAAFKEGFGKERAAREIKLGTDIPDAVAFLATRLDSAVSTGPKSKAEICDIAMAVASPRLLHRVINRELGATGKPKLMSIDDAQAKCVRWACEWVARQAIQRLVADGRAEFNCGTWILRKRSS
jgi:putative DNA primase/helicase